MNRIPEESSPDIKNSSIEEENVIGNQSEEKKLDESTDNPGS